MISAEQRLLTKVAQPIIDRLVRKSVSELQKVGRMLASEDSGLRDVWDEICVQVQGQQSVGWADYEEVLQSTVAGEVERLGRLDLGVLWLQTEAGFDWLLENRESQEEVPSTRDDVEEFLVQQVLNKAGDWTNSRINRYLNPPGADLE